MQRISTEHPCWCCGRGTSDSPYMCPRCAMHGAVKVELNDREIGQLNFSWRGLWDRAAWEAAHPGQAWGEP